MTLLDLTIPSHGESSRHGCTCVRTRCAGRSARQTSCSRTRKARALFPLPFSLIPSDASPQNKNNFSVFSAFFRKGQVIETFRGASIYQPAVDLAIEKLRVGAWVCCPVFAAVIRSGLLIIVPCAETAHPRGYVDSPFCGGQSLSI